MKAPSKPRPTIHQICQMAAKPVTTAKKEVTKPVELLSGISIASYSTGAGSIRPSRARRFMYQKASSLSTSGITAKFQLGGGDGVAHSSVRPFQGSPVRSRY